jgi:dipeptidase E
MRLLLSGGNAEGVVIIDEFFISRIDLNKTVLYIPVADYEINYSKRFEWFKSTYQPYGVTNIELCTDLSKATISDNHTAIYIGGGNTYKLLKEIKENGFDKKLIDFINRNGFVYGLSAGSIIFSKDITSTTYETENERGFNDTSGLNFAKGFNICCHYGNGDEDNTNYKRNRILKYSAQSNGTIALPNGCAAYIQDEAVTFIGSGALLFKA